jgi:hypothetical protein
MLSSPAATLGASVAERPIALPPERKREAIMPGGPKQCHLYALHCAEMAATVKTQQLKATFLELSQNWLRLADSLEKTQALLYEHDVDCDKPA